MEPGCGQFKIGVGPKACFQLNVGPVGQLKMIPPIGEAGNPVTLSQENGLNPAA